MYIRRDNDDNKEDDGDEHRDGNDNHVHVSSASQIGSDGHLKHI